MHPIGCKLRHLANFQSGLLLLSKKGGKPALLSPTLTGKGGVLLDDARSGVNLSAIYGLFDVL